MRINDVNGVNTQMGQRGMNQETDAYSRNLQNQIANAEKQLQELSSNKEMTIEEKMMKRQEIKKQITDLKNQLRQHQIEQRKEQQQSKSSSVEDMLGGCRKAAQSGKQGSELSQASMTALISADSSMKQAKVQGSMATKMAGRAGVLESEIKMDKGRGASTEKKEEELTDLKAKVQSATAAQMSTLTDANKAIEEASKADRKAESENRNDQTDKTDEVQKKSNDEAESTESADNAVPETAAEASATTTTVKISGAETGQSETQKLVYTPIDVKL